MINTLTRALAILVSCLGSVYGQTCSEPGQNPQTAFPVCGEEVFTQSQVKSCGNRPLPGPCQDEGITDKNPYWYKFTCFTAGTLGFLITPADNSDDYDWQLFDITGRDPADIYTIRNLFIACNWSGETGKTGASDQGSSLSVCTGSGKPLFSAMPQLTQGHEYLLLISHFTESQSGYTLEFGGGTASITDPAPATLLRARGSCSGNEVGIRLSKLLRCESLATDGSDFSISSGGTRVIRAFAPRCGDAFDMDSLVLVLDNALPPGNYTVNVQQGSDGNTLLDACDVAMAAGSVTFTVPQDVSAAFTQQVFSGCRQDTVVLAHDGANGVNSWTWQANGAVISSRPTAELRYARSEGRNIVLTVSNGFCADTASLSIAGLPVVDAAFEAPEIICATERAVFTNTSTGSITGWLWDFGNGQSSTARDPSSFNYPRPQGETTYRVTLQVSDAAGCVDSASASVIVAGNCTIAVPSAFTPNNDGRNDELYPSNAFVTSDLLFRVYNRYGQVVFESKDWKRRWNGQLNSRLQPAGTYVWFLRYTLRTTGRVYQQRGTTILIR